VPFSLPMKNMGLYLVSKYSVILGVYFMHFFFFNPCCVVGYRGSVVTHSTRETDPWYIAIGCLTVEVGDHSRLALKITLSERQPESARRRNEQETVTV